MLTIRVAKRQRSEAWRAMIEIAPIRLIAKDPVYEVLPAHVELLKSLGISFEILNPRAAVKGKRRHASSD